MATPAEGPVRVDDWRSVAGASAGAVANGAPAYGSLNVDAGAAVGACTGGSVEEVAGGGPLVASKSKPHDRQYRNDPVRAVRHPGQNSVAIAHLLCVRPSGAPFVILRRGPRSACVRLGHRQTTSHEGRPRPLRSPAQ